MLEKQMLELAIARTPSSVFPQLQIRPRFFRKPSNLPSNAIMRKWRPFSS